MDLLKRPEIDLDLIGKITNNPITSPQVKEQIEINTKYEGYIHRQNTDIKKTIKNKNTHIPLDFDYSTISGLSNEVRQKLEDTKPIDIGQAGRIPGVTPAAISLLLVFLKDTQSKKVES